MPSLLLSFHIDVNKFLILVWAEGHSVVIKIVFEHIINFNFKLHIKYNVCNAPINGYHIKKINIIIIPFSIVELFLELIQFNWLIYCIFVYNV